MQMANNIDESTHGTVDKADTPCTWGRDNLPTQRVPKKILKKMD